MKFGSDMHEGKLTKADSKNELETGGLEGGSLTDREIKEEKKRENDGE